MHPEILRELGAQRGREMQVQAQQAMLARAASRMRRALRHGAGAAGAVEFAIPAIPDYVDGSFRTDERAASQSGHVPAGRNAA